LRNKEERTKAIYKKLYGFSLGEDFTPFNLILDTDNLKSEEVFQVLCEVIDNVIVNSDNIKIFDNTQNCNLKNVKTSKFILKTTVIGYILGINGFIRKF